MVTGTLGITLISLAGGCARHEDAQPLNEARTGVSEVIAMLERGEVGAAEKRFGQIDGVMHETAALVERLNPETAEVINDITEYLKGRMRSERADPESLLDTTGRALAWLETAHLDLHG